MAMAVVGLGLLDVASFGDAGAGPDRPSMNNGAVPFSMAGGAKQKGRAGGGAGQFATGHPRKRWMTRRYDG